jgi:hypothetical protein
VTPSAPAAAATAVTANAPTVATAATTTIATTSNNDVDESLDIDPNHFMCPITKLIMTNTVSDAFGHSYEKAAIELCLSKHSTSPVTGAWLQNKTLTLNHALQNIIHDSRSCTTTAAPAAFNEEVGRELTIVLRDASGWAISESGKKQKKSEQRPFTG